MSNCPSCGSTNTKSKVMVFAGGTRQIGGSGGSVGMSSSGRVSVRSGRSSQTSQSMLAAGCTPPKPSILPKAVVGILVFLFWLPLFSGLVKSFNEPSVLHMILNVAVLSLILAAMTYGLVKLYKHLDRKNKQAIQDYADSWLCLRCGTSFKP